MFFGRAKMISLRLKVIWISTNIPVSLHGNHLPQSQLHLALRNLTSPKRSSPLISPNHLCRRMPQPLYSGAPWPGGTFSVMMWWSKIYLIFLCSTILASNTKGLYAKNHNRKQYFDSLSWTSQAWLSLTIERILYSIAVIILKNPSLTTSCPPCSQMRKIKSNKKSGMSESLNRTKDKFEETSDLLPSSMRN